VIGKGISGSRTDGNGNHRPEIGRQKSAGGRQKPGIGIEAKENSFKDTAEVVPDATEGVTEKE